MRSKEKAQNKPKRQTRITVRLMRGIVLILFLTILLPVVAYNKLPDWTFYLTSATRLWLATDDIESSYGTDEFLQKLENIEKTYDSNIEMYSSDGRFIYSTLAFIEKLPKSLDSAKTIDEKYKLEYQIVDGSLNAAGRGYLIKAYDGNGITVDFLECYSTLPGGERLEICMQVSQVSTTAKIDFFVAFILMMTALMFALLFITFYINRFGKPIRNMCEITDNMSKLDFSEKCPPTGIAELTSLSDSINTMSSSLDSALTDLKQKNEKLEQDIENERTIDALRQTFISGISHELKTPITIIQGYAEGAKMFYESGNAETAGEYCTTIMEEATRMNNMIMKLLEITKYDSGAYEPIREDFDVRGLVEDWFERNSSITAEKEVNIVNSIPEGLTGNGDTVILASVVNNYLSNALSHVEGEKRIETSVESVDGKYRVYVFNTGKKIEDKDIDKIWTSFYRADKSLSRSQGRFGLGLAIVSSVQRLHNEKFGVENVDGGVRFWFDIKKSENSAG